MLDEVDDLINMVDGDLVALENVHLAQRLLQVKLGATADDAFLEADILVQNGTKRHDLGFAVDQHQHVDGKGGLE